MPGFTPTRGLATEQIVDVAKTRGLSQEQIRKRFIRYRDINESAFFGNPVDPIITIFVDIPEVVMTPYRAA